MVRKEPGSMVNACFVSVDTPNPMFTADVLVSWADLRPRMVTLVNSRLVVTSWIGTVVDVLVTVSWRIAAGAWANTPVTLTATIKDMNASFFIRCLWCGLLGFTSVKCYSARESNISFSLFPGSVIGMAAVRDGCNQYDCRF